ncbi:hypothetical protein ACMFMG_011109 [Clarireedia jacksonii]
MASKTQHAENSGVETDGILPVEVGSFLLSLQPEEIAIKLSNISSQKPSRENHPTNPNQPGTILCHREILEAILRLHIRRIINHFTNHFGYRVSETRERRTSQGTHGNKYSDKFHLRRAVGTYVAGLAEPGDDG